MKDLKIGSILVFLLVLSIYSGNCASQDLMTEPASLKIVPASEILGKMERGEPVEYKNVLILGDLNLSGLDLPRQTNRFAYKMMGEPIAFFDLPETVKVVKSPIKIVMSEIQGTVDFRNAIFEKNIYFILTKIRGNANFRGAQFRNGADFEVSQFGGYANFSWSKFNGDADFGLSQFGSDAEFWSAQFSDNANFMYADFNGDANFRSVKFNCTNFENSTFRGYADFSASEFSGNNADFWMSKFNGDANFWMSDFSGMASFPESQFSGNANFSQSRLGIYTFFWKSQFSGDADFSLSQFGDHADFRGSQFDRYGNFSMSMFSKNTGFIIDWYDAKNHLICDDPIYQILIESLKSRGLFDEADDCYYQRMENLPVRSTSDWIIRKLSWATCGYGVRPFQTLILSVLIVGLFGLVYWYKKGVRKTTHNRVRWRPKVCGTFSLPEAIYFSALVFFVALPPPAWEAKGIWKYVILAEDILGWLLTTLFVVTLGNVMIR